MSKYNAIKDSRDKKLGSFMCNGNKYFEFLVLPPAWTKLIVFISTGIIFLIFIFLNGLAVNLHWKALLVTAIMALAASTFGALSLQVSHLISLLFDKQLSLLDRVLGILTLLSFMLAIVTLVIFAVSKF